MKKTKKKGGRPTRYKAEYVEQAERMAMLGMTDGELAKVFGVTDDTITNWKKRHKDFRIALMRGREDACGKVVAAMFKNAVGYEHKEDKIFNSPQGGTVIVPTIKHYQPNQAAAQYFLKNKDPERWRDKTEVQVSGEASLFKLKKVKGTKK